MRYVSGRCKKSGGTGTAINAGLVELDKGRGFILIRISFSPDIFPEPEPTLFFFVIYLYVAGCPRVKRKRGRKKVFLRNIRSTPPDIYSIMDEKRDDDAQLAGLGHRQELQRNFSTLYVFF